MNSPTHTHIVELITRYNKTSGLSLLDFGCGDGMLLEAAQKLQIAKYTGVDINSHSLQLLKQRHPENNVSVFTINTDSSLRLGRNNQFDVVTAIGVMQYLSSKQINRFLRESNRVVKKNGILVFSCSSDSWFYHAMNMYKFFLPHRYFTTGQIMKLLTATNFRIVEVTQKGRFFSPFFSYFFVFFIDALDKLFFRNKGRLGPLGTATRRLARPLLEWEFKREQKSGYTTFVVAQKLS